MNLQEILLLFSNIKKSDIDKLKKDRSMYNYDLFLVKIMNYFKEAKSITNLYFTSPFSILSYASFIC